MEMLITLILRLSSLSPTVSEETSVLLQKVRAITFKWITALRLEIQMATDVSASQRSSRLVFFVALLCRRTFAMNAEVETFILDPSSLQCFIECSITLQDNLVGDPTALPPLVRNALVRDLKMVYKMKKILKQSLERSPKSLVSSIANFWPEIEGGRTESPPQCVFLPEPENWWVEMVIEPTQETTRHVIHFHLLEGHLLVMGQVSLTLS